MLYLIHVIDKFIPKIWLIFILTSFIFAFIEPLKNTTHFFFSTRSFKFIHFSFFLSFKFFYSSLIFINIFILLHSTTDKVYPTLFLFSSVFS
jgi:hypothetical protein